MLKRSDSISRWITLAGTHQGHLPTQSSMRLACTCLGVCHPALSSPLKPERPRGDQSGHLGDPGGRAERAELAQGQAAMPHGVRACPGSMGARLPLGCFQRAPTFALRWHGGWGKGRGGNTRPLDSPAGPQASTVPPSPKHPLGDPESCRRAVGRADAAGGRGRRAAPRQGWGGQRERPHVGQQPRPTSNLLQV